MEKISCISVCLNDRKGLLRTFQSAVEQSYRLFEIIIIDGGSVDGTQKEFKKMERVCAEKGIRFIALSENDSGVFNAMNKGIMLASGDWIVFMNSGDVFAGNDVLNNVYQSRDFADSDVIYCDYELETNGVRKNKKAYSLDNITKGPVTCHQAMLTRTEKLKERGYQEKYRICADYEWYLDFYLKKGRFEYVPVSFCIFDGTGMSMVNTTETYLEVSSMRAEKGVGDSKWVIAIKSPIIWVYGVFLRFYIKATKKKSV